MERGIVGGIACPNIWSQSMGSKMIVKKQPAVSLALSSVILGHCQDKHENSLGKIYIFLINKCSKLCYQNLSPYVPTKPYIQTLIPNLHTTALSKITPDTTKFFNLYVKSSIATFFELWNRLNNCCET